MVNLEKGQKIELTKENPNLKKLLVGLGWDVNSNGGSAFDLDASALLLDSNGKLQNNSKVVYYGNLKSTGVTHTGDNLTGAGDGDDEQLLVNLDEIPSDVEKIVFVVTIYQAGSRHQNFGMVSNAFIRVANNETNEEICKYDLGEDYSTEKSVIIGEIYRHNGEWKFGALGNGFNGELGEILSSYGLN